MKIFPVTSISNFFKDPDEVVKFAKSLKYTKPKEGIYPGVRTENLHDIDYAFFNQTIRSILSVYFEDIQHVNFSKTFLGFHKIKPYSKSLKDVRNKGWIHHDGTALGGLIYLNKERYLQSRSSADIDGFQWHNMDNIYCNSKEDRLTLVFFIHKIQARDCPKLRLDKIQSFDKNIYLQYFNKENL